MTFQPKKVYGRDNPNYTGAEKATGESPSGVDSKGTAFEARQDFPAGEDANVMTSEEAHILADQEVEYFKDEYGDEVHDMLVGRLEDRGMSGDYADALYESMMDDYYGQAYDELMFGEIEPGEFSPDFEADTEDYVENFDEQDYYESMYY